MKHSNWLCAGISALSLIGSAAAQEASPDDPIMFVVDGSNSMWGQMDGIAKIELTKSAFADMLPKLDASRPAGLVMYGHRQTGSCEDIELVSAPATKNRSQLTASVNGLSPRGKTPITAALKTAADALPDGGNGTIVLLSDGIETCKADPCAMAQALKEKNIEFTVHVIGVDLRKPADKAALACIADRTGGTFTDIETADSLSDALKDTTSAEGKTDLIQPLRYELRAIDGMEGPVIADARFEILSAADKQVIASQIEDGYDFLPGDYEIIARSGERSGTLETRILKDDETRTITIVIDAALPEASLSFTPSVPAASVLSIAWEGPNGEGDYIELLDAEGQRLEESYFVYTADGAPSLLRVPGDAGAYSLRYVYASLNAPLVTEPLTVTPALASLTLSADAEVGAFVDISWEGPAGEGDMIGIFPAGTPVSERNPLNYERVAKGNPVRVQMPGTEGDYETRYLTGNDMTVLAAAPIRLIPAQGAINAPESAALGEAITIDLTGRFNPDQDYVTIVPVGAGASAYQEYAYTDGSAPVILRTPIETGDFEIRIVREAGDQNQVLFSKPIAITPSVATLSAPATIAAGGTLNVVANGPVSREGDDDVYIAITGPDEGAGSYSGGYEYVITAGETIAITVPDEPGSYELRYIANGYQPTILARQPLTIQ
ncbi:VWA domain-containing protein [Ponticaulis profundi]|uniref:VWA domain-containing protein n=1 Tax=Ponticaulis profundi TaxID=2665222 RepID=A0ABW1S683_9PROT